MRKYIDEIEVDGRNYIQFLFLPYLEDFGVLKDIIEKKIKAEPIVSRDGVWVLCSTYRKGDLIFDLYYHEDLDGNFLRGGDSYGFFDEYEALKLLANEILKHINLDEFKYKYYKEIDDILRAIQWQNLIIGEVKGSVIIFYKHLIPDTFDLSQMNDKGAGIIFKNISKDGRSCVFNFENSSIYDFLSELEYFRNISRSYELPIETIEIVLNFDNIKFYRPNIDSEKYNRLAKNEMNDLKNCYKIERVFSGSLNIDYIITYDLIEEKTVGSRESPSIYSFLIELERIIREGRKKKISKIQIKLNRLDNSLVKYDSVLNKNRYN